MNIKNNTPSHRFEAEVADSLAYIDYVLEGDSMTLSHTIVPPELEGQGIGSKLVKAALEFAKNQSLKVNPQCPFVAQYIQRHQEYKDLVL